MSSHTAAVIQYLLSVLTLDPVPQGISVPPCPPAVGKSGTYITVHEISAMDMQTLGGPSDYSDSIIQINCFSNDHEAAAAMRSRCKTAIVNYTGKMADLISNGSEHMLDSYLFDGERILHQQVSRIHFVFVTDEEIISMIPVFTIVPGSAIHRVKVTVQLAPNTPFILFLTTQANGACADWWNPPGGFINLGGNFPNSTGGNNLVGGRGGILGCEFQIAQIAAIALASVWVLSDVNGFFDCEILSAPNNPLYACAIVPANTLVSVSRHILAGDYA